MKNYCFGKFDEPYFSAQLDSRYDVIYPTIPPLPGQQVVGYWIYPPNNKLFVPPCTRPMNFFGIFSSVILVFLFWPVSCVPFCMGCSYNGYQVPIYE